MTDKLHLYLIHLIDGEFTVKRFRNRDGRIYLEAANDQFPKIEVSGDQELVVWGVVSFVIHPAR